MLQELGTILAVGGASLTVIGTLINNLQNKHWRAKKIWGISNPLLLIWAAGFILGLWTSNLAMLFVAGMYLAFTVTNWYSLVVGGAFGRHGE